MQSDLKIFQQLLMYNFINENLLIQALTHVSYHNERKLESFGHNERFEFLGDSVLDLILSDLLMKRFPEEREGFLSKMRANFVNEAFLAMKSKEIGLDNGFLKLGKGEILTKGLEKPRILSSSFEAIVGAIYLDGGYEKTFEVVKRFFENDILNLDPNHYDDGDWKTRLQEKVQEIYKIPPTYHLLNKEGPDHEKTFLVELLINGEQWTQGVGRSKKQAEQNAAKQAFHKLAHTADQSTLKAIDFTKRL